MLLEVNTDGSDKMCFFSLIDRINFWDFGGHADYDEIRVELYGQTQVRVKLMSSKKNLHTIVTWLYTHKFPLSFPFSDQMPKFSIVPRSLAIFRCDITCQACQRIYHAQFLTPFAHSNSVNWPQRTRLATFLVTCLIIIGVWMQIMISKCTLIIREG